MISEVVATNDQGLEDEDDDRSDWIELYNAGDEPAKLNGWHLTDNVQEPAKWTFPDVTLNPDNYLVLFASGKDRRDPDRNLHTNFRISADGEYLGLIEPNGSTVAFEFAPQFPALLPDRSFGLPQDSVRAVIAESGAGIRVLVPSEENGGDALRESWTEVDFDDVDWMAGTGGVGFGAALEEFVGVDVREQMHGKNSTAFIRIPFAVQQPDIFFSAALRLRYNDGYVAYLNGQEIARANSPKTPAWNSVATTNRVGEQAKLFEEVDITKMLGLLHKGQNVLAIHGMNRSRTSSDFLIAAELRAERPAELGNGPARYFENASPGRSNGSVSYAGLLPNSQASIRRGFFDEPFETVLSVETAGATLVYTTDGSIPTLENGVLVPPANSVTGPSTTVNISNTTTLRVAAFKDDFLASRVETQTYIFLRDVLTQGVQATVNAGFPEKWKGADPDYGLDPDVIGPGDLFDGVFARQIVDSLMSVPTISLVAEIEDLFDFDTGIYMNSLRSGPDWERPTSVELIYPDGSTGFQENAGIRIQGENVRNLAGSRKQSFRLVFRKEYGATKLRFPVFGDDAADRFDTLILRGFYNDRWVSPSSQYIRDQWAMSTLLDMEQPNSHGIFVHVYLNGFYWGMYNLIERPNASFSSSYFGGDKDEWDALNSGQVRDGTADAWNQLRRESRKVKTNDPQQSNEAYLRLLGKNADGTDDPDLPTLLDVENYIDYLIVNFYGGNNDWPHKNYYVGRQRGPDSTGFKFYAWDSEKILDHDEASGLMADQTDVTSGAAQMYASLRTNDEFRLTFADRVHRHFFNGGSLYVDPLSPEWDPANPDHNVPAARYDAIASQAELPLVGESARWGDSNSNRPLTLIDWQAKRHDLIANYFPQRSAIVLAQFVQAGLYPELAAPVFSQHGGVIEPGFEFSMDAPGDVYYTLDGTDPRRSALQPGVAESGKSPNAIQYTGPITLDGRTVVKARTLADGQWSALNEATFTLDSPPLRVSEIMYHPRAPEAEGQFEDDDFEYIELLNISDTDSIDLEGIAFAGGIEFMFPKMSLAPGQRMVIVRDQGAFRQRYGEGINIAGQYGTPEDYKLSNGGETLRLEDSFGDVIQEFTYDDAWIPSTDGGGHSLTVVDVRAELDGWSSAAAWRASTALDGSPGIDDNVDFNGDGRTDVGDIDLFCAGRRANDLRFDLTGDGLLDHVDVAFLVRNILGTTFGDTNLDGTFNSRDLDSVFQTGQYLDAVAGNSTWSTGDWNCDGEFDTNDLVLALQNGGYVAAATAPGDTDFPL